MEINIREVKKNDFEEIWEIFQEIIEDGNFYIDDKNTTKEFAYHKWMVDPKKTFVAEKDNQILGCYSIKSNFRGKADHISNASYMVDSKSRGYGIGKKLISHSIKTAKEMGYLAMQFNQVISINKKAVELFQSFGFKIIGTIPNGVRHENLGFVDLYIMYLDNIQK